MSYSNNTMLILVFHEARIEDSKHCTVNKYKPVSAAYQIKLFPQRMLPS